MLKFLPVSRIDYEVDMVFHETVCIDLTSEGFLPFSQVLEIGEIILVPCKNHSSLMLSLYDMVGIVGQYHS